MWFWIIVGFIFLWIFSNWAKEAREEYRDKKKTEQLEEINEKLGEEDTEDFLNEVRSK